MISLYDILEVSNGQLFGEPAAQIFTDFCVDYELAGPNMLFVTLKTDSGDTHRFAEEAIKRGVAGVICNRPPDCDTENVSVVLVHDTLQAMMAWASHTLGKMGTKVIAVTGSAGKSGTVEAISHVLSSRYKVLKTPPEALDHRLGIPMTLARLRNDHQYAVLRLPVMRPGEMAAMVETARPDVGVITAINHANLEYFETMDQIVRETSLLLEYLSPSGMAVLNHDDDLVRELAPRTRAEVMTIGVESFGAKMMAYNVIVSLSGTGFDLRYSGDKQVGRWIPLLGKHQLYGVLSAVAVGSHYGIPVEESLRALKNIDTLPGRMNPLIGINDCVMIDDTHSADPESTLMALEWLENAKDKNQRAIFVLGDMDNLGAYSPIGHRYVGQRAAEVAQVLITEGTEAAAAARAALDKNMETRNIVTSYSPQDTVNLIRERFQVNSDDIVLIKGGAAMQMERVVRALLKNPEEDARHLARQNSITRAAPLFQPTRPSWIEVDTDALATNINEIKNLVGEEVAVMAVVKADGYGHGAVKVSQTALMNGAEYLAVASLQEALDLREAGIDAPILTLGYTPSYAIRQAIRQNITISLYDVEMARTFERAAAEVGNKLRVHIKIDSGMGRMGIMPDNVMGLFRLLPTLTHLDIEGIYTHFSSSDGDPAYTAEQMSIFRNVLRPLRASGFNLKYTHAANSASIFLSKDYHLNMVRVGAAMYGIHPSETVMLPSDFKPVMSWKTVVAQVKTLPPGHPVGYGNTYITKGEERIAVIPVGYADGFRRSPDWGEVLLHGKRAPVIGRISMEKSVIRVNHIPNVSVGDEVVLLGGQDDDAITAEEIAQRLGTINYEVICNVLPRVPRR